MKKQFKQTYLSPETETLLVQSESVVLGGGSPYGNQGAAGPIIPIVLEGDDY